MFTRRELIGAGFTAAGVSGGEQPVAIDPRRFDDMTEQVEAIAAELRQANSGCSTGTCQAVGRIREAMTVFLRANAKFPDAMEVGPAVFFEVYDWHVRNRLSLSAVRLPDGRYAMGFMFTRLLLRSDAQPDFVGVAYDVRP